mgnify:FL=1
MELQLKAIMMSWELLESECRRLGIPLLERKSNGISDLHKSAERLLDRHYSKILNQLINNK